MEQPLLFPEFQESPESQKHPKPTLFQDIPKIEGTEHVLSALRSIQKPEDIIGRLHIFTAHLNPNESIWLELSNLKSQHDTIQSRLTHAKITQDAADKEYDIWDRRGGMMPENVRLWIQQANAEVNTISEELDTIAKKMIKLLSSHFETQK